MPNILRTNVEGGYYITPNHIVIKGHLKAMGADTFAVYSVLTQLSNSTDIAFPSVPKLAEYTGLCENTVRKSLKKLGAAKYISKVEEHNHLGKTNHYQVVFDLPDVKVAAKVMAEIEADDKTKKKKKPSLSEPPSPAEPGSRREAPPGSSGEPNIETYLLNKNISDQQSESVFSEEKNIESSEKKPRSHKKRINKTTEVMKSTKLSDDFLWKVHEIYHREKPDVWFKLEKHKGGTVPFNDDEVDAIKRYLVKSSTQWSQEVFLEKFEKALKYANDSFYQKSEWAFTNFMTNDKVRKFANYFEQKQEKLEAEKQALMEDMRSLHPLKRVELDPSLVDEHTIEKGGCLWKPPHEEKVKYYSFFEGELFEWYSPALCRAFWEFVNPYIEAGGITVDDSVVINPKMMLYFAVAQRGNLDFKGFRIQSTMYLTPDKEEIIDLKGLHAVTADETEIPVFIPREYWKGQHKRESARFGLLLASYRTHPRKVSQPVATA